MELFVSLIWVDDKGNRRVENESILSNERIAGWTRLAKLCYDKKPDQVEIEVIS